MMTDPQTRIGGISGLIQLHGWENNILFSVLEQVLLVEACKVVEAESRHVVPDYDGAVGRVFNNPRLLHHWKLGRSADIKAALRKIMQAHKYNYAHEKRTDWPTEVPMPANYLANPTVTEPRAANKPAADGGRPANRTRDYERKGARKASVPAADSHEAKNTPSPQSSATSRVHTTTQVKTESPYQPGFPSQDHVHTASVVSYHGGFASNPATELPLPLNAMVIRIIRLGDHGDETQPFQCRLSRLVSKRHRRSGESFTDIGLVDFHRLLIQLEDDDDMIFDPETEVIVNPARPGASPSRIKNQNSFEAELQLQYNRHVDQFRLFIIKAETWNSSIPRPFRSVGQSVRDTLDDDNNAGELSSYLVPDRLAKRPRLQETEHSSERPGTSSAVFSGAMNPSAIPGHIPSSNSIGWPAFPRPPTQQIKSETSPSHKSRRSEKTRTQETKVVVFDDSDDETSTQPLRQRPEVPMASMTSEEQQMWNRKRPFD
ncbi:hypothetical protein BDV97DRAFT_389660 [Delphinella strobiligena]|nr:hypothetical protein BDV97DRAFT_389660 [Delphinella strobiligena]